MEIRNLREPDVEALQEKVRELQRENPDIRSRLFGIPEEDHNHVEILEKLNRLEDKLDALTRKIELIFGDSVLINGRFESIQK